MSEYTGSVVLPSPEQFGFCEGVVSADDLLRTVTGIAHDSGVSTVYGYHDIVHNREVRGNHEQNGVVFVNDTAEIPDFSVVVTSAHGVSPEVEYELQQKNCVQFDAACPLVIATHRRIQTARDKNEKVIYIGHGKPGKSAKLHDEIIGALGHMDFEIQEDGYPQFKPVERVFLELGEDLEAVPDLMSETGKYHIVTQTTLNDLECLDYQQQIAAFIEDFQPAAAISKVERSNVCSAVRQRQGGVVVLLANPTVKPDRLVVVTDPKSANGMGYYHQAVDIIKQSGLLTEVIAVATPEELADVPKTGITAITASASTPDATTRAVAREFGAGEDQLVWKRGKYSLRDDDPKVIKTRIDRLLHKLQESDVE